MELSKGSQEPRNEEDNCRTVAFRELEQVVEHADSLNQFDKLQPWFSFRGNTHQLSNEDYANLPGQIKREVVSLGLLMRIKGIVVRKRTLSKKLFFMDIVECDKDEREVETLELIIRIPVLPLSKVVQYRDNVRLTDTIEIIGFPERRPHCGNEIFFHVVDLKVLETNPKYSRSPVSEEQETRYRALDRLVQSLEQQDVAKRILGKREVELPLCRLWCESELNIPEKHYQQQGNNNHLNHSESTCQRRHYFLDQKERERYKQLLARPSVTENDPDADHDHTHDDKKKHSKRDVVFVDWLISKFPFLNDHQYQTTDLNENSKIIDENRRTILDVAGGRGFISFELHTKRQIPCTLIDPRPMKLGKKHYKWFKVHKKQKSSELQDYKQPPLAHQIQTLFNEQFFSDEKHRKLVENSLLLLGMHPDQATEVIVDTALRFNKNFAVLPCCVFPKEFPDRRLVTSTVIVQSNTGNQEIISTNTTREALISKELPPGETTTTITTEDGSITTTTTRIVKEIVTYSEFIEYLKAKDSRIQVDYLPIEGRHKILYLTHENTNTS